MGLINTSLVIGRNAIGANELAMDVVGNNIANSATEGFARQSSVFVDTPSTRIATGMYVGTGATLETIRRVADFFLEEQIRNSQSSVSDLEVREQSLSRIEAAFNETTDRDISTALNRFFDTLEELQNNPGQLALRTNVAQEGRTLATVFHEVAASIDTLASDLDVQVQQLVESVNSITSQVAELNVAIVRGQAGASAGGGQHELENRRDVLLGELAEIIGISVAKQPSGAVSVYLGGDPLVFDDQHFEVAAEARSAGAVIIHDVVFVSDGHAVTLDGGRLAGVVASRQAAVPQFEAALDDLARNLIWEMNRIHSQGMGLAGFADVTSADFVTDPTATLDAAGLHFNVENGSFVINILNRVTGQMHSFDIDVDLDGIGADSTLNSIVAEIAGEITSVFPQITASVTPDYRIRIRSSSSNLELAFGPDSSGFLAAVGLNTLFTGHDAATFDVNTRVTESPSLLAAATSSNAGDNSNVVRMTQLRNAAIEGLDGGSFANFIESTASVLAVQGRTTAESRATAEDFLGSLRSRRETISGVDLNEEAINIIRYQNAFRGAGQFVVTISRLIEVVLGLV